MIAPRTNLRRFSSTALLILAVGGALASCHRRTVDESCRRRQAVYEAANPHERSEFGQKMREVAIGLCKRQVEVRKEQEGFRCRDRCLDNVPNSLQSGSPEAKQAFKLLQACEAQCPGQYCSAQPDW